MARAPHRAAYGYGRNMEVKGQAVGGVRLRRWTDADLPILEGSNTAEMTRFLGGPESEPQLRHRHEVYLRGWDAGTSRMFAIVGARGEPLGGIGVWGSGLPNGPDAWETGWSVLPHAQRKGVAKAALALLVEDLKSRIARGDAAQQPLAAFPSVANTAANALCRGAGFAWTSTLVEEFRGVQLTLNVWVLDLS